MLGMMKSRGNENHLTGFDKRRSAYNVGMYRNQRKHAQTRSIDNTAQLIKNGGGAGVIGVKRKSNNSSNVGNKRQRKTSPKSKGSNRSKSTNTGKHKRKPVAQKRAKSKQAGKSIASHRRIEDVI